MFRLAGWCSLGRIIDLCLRCCKAKFRPARANVIDLAATIGGVREPDDLFSSRIQHGAKGTAPPAQPSRHLTSLMRAAAIMALAPT